MTLDNFNFNEENINTGKTGKKGPLSNLSPLFFIFISLALVFFLYQIVGGAMTYMLLGEDLQTMNDNLNLTRIIMSFAQFMFILIPTVLLVLLQDHNLKETFRLRMPGIPVLILSVIGIIVIQPFLQVYLYYQNEFIFSLPFGQEILNQLKELFDTLESTTEKLVVAKSVPEFLLILFAIAVTPAVCEEFLFRGLVFKNFEKIIPASKAVFFSGLLFALFHFHPFNLIPLAILGIFLSFTVYHSGSIYTAVICHFINNFVSATAVYIYGAETLDSDKLNPDELMQYLILGIFSVAVFITVIILIKKYSVMKSDNDKTGKTNYTTIISTDKSNE